MAGVRQLGWKAIPAVRSGYGADTLPDRYRSDCTKRSFRSIIIRLRQTVITVITEGIPLIQYIAERFAQSGFFRQSTILLHHPFMRKRII